jgi:hypothetical protein
MTGALLLYLAYQGFALLLCLWAACSAVQNLREHDPLHRIWTLLAALSLPLVFGTVLYARLAGRPELMWVEVALPVVAFATTFVNVVTLHSQGVLLKLVHTPVFVLNAALTGIFTLRVLQDWIGLDLGIFGGSILHGYGLLQGWIGQRDAAADPHWLHMPLLLPLWLRYRLHHEVTLLSGSVLACAFVGLLATRMPIARATVAGYRTAAADRHALDQLTRPLRLGFAVRGIDRPGADVDAWQDQLARLRATSVTIEVAPELVEEQACLERLAAAVSPLRGGRELVVVVQPPRRFLGVPARDLSELSNAMAKAHWLAAERLQPDVLVAFSGPFGALASAIASPPTLERWQQTITRAAVEVRQACASTKIAVAIDHAAPHTRELFQWLAGPKSPVDIAGFALLPREQTFAQLNTDLDAFERWAQAAGSGQQVRVLLAGVSPHACGGELGQWSFLAAVLAFAQRTPNVTDVAIVSLADTRDATGLTANLGQPRVAFERLVQYAANLPKTTPTQARPTPPPR